MPECIKCTNCMESQSFKAYRSDGSKKKKKKPANLCIKKSGSLVLEELLLIDEVDV